MIVLRFGVTIENWGNIVASQDLDQLVPEFFGSDATDSTGGHDDEGDDTDSTGFEEEEEEGTDSTGFEEDDDTKNLAADARPAGDSDAAFRRWLANSGLAPR
jgi:hypothetical protein